MGEAFHAGRTCHSSPRTKNARSRIPWPPHSVSWRTIVKMTPPFFFDFDTSLSLSLSLSSRFLQLLFFFGPEMQRSDWVPNAVRLDCGSGQSASLMDWKWTMLTYTHAHTRYYTLSIKCGWVYSEIITRTFTLTLVCFKLLIENL